MKINNTEVKLGNFVYYKDQVYRIQTNDILIVSIKNNDFRSIDLTTSWLEMFGIKESMVEGHWWYEEETEDDILIINIRQIKDKFYFCVPITSDGQYSNVCEVKSVHQLQNLFSALYNQDLLIKENEL